MLKSQKKDGLLSMFVKFSSGTWITAIIGFLSIPVTTRLVLPEEFGKATIFVLVVNLMSRICLAGSDQGLVRKYFEVNLRNRPKLLWSSLVVPAIISTVFLITSLFFWKPISLYILNELEFFAIAILSVTVFIHPFFLQATQLVRMANKAKEYSLLNILKAIINVATIILYAKFIEPNFYSIVWGTFLSTVVTLFIAVIMEKGLWFSKIKIVPQYVKELTTLGLPFIPTFIFIWLMESMDKFILAELSTFEEVGIYSAAFKVVGVLTLLKVGFQNFWIPVSLDYYQNKEDAKSFFSRIAELIIPLFCLIISLFVLFSDYLILLLGQEYQSAGILIPLLVFVPLATFIREITGRGIDFSKKTYWHILATFLAAFVNLLGNYFLIPNYGSKGAAIATAISYIIYLGVISLISNALYSFKLKWDKLITLLIMFFFISTAILFQWELGLNHNIVLALKVAVVVSVIIIYFKNFVDLKIFIGSQIKKVFL